MSACVLIIPNIVRCSTIERPSVIQAACAEEASLVLSTVAAVKFCFQDACSVDIMLPPLSYGAAVGASGRARWLGDRAPALDLTIGRGLGPSVLP